MDINQIARQHLLPRQVASALLAGWLLILSFAGVSPALHDWLHQASECAHECNTHPEEEPAESTDHYCGVIALQGAVAEFGVIALPERASFVKVTVGFWSKRIYAKTIAQTFQARAPPVEIIV